MGGPFDPSRAEVRKAFLPLTFPRVTVKVADELVMTGRVKDVSPTQDVTSTSVGVTVYSLPYDLGEVCAPASLLPLEFSGLDLRQIAQRVVTPTLGVGLVFDGPPGATFAKIRVEPTDTIHGVIADLALQRGFVVSDMPNGDLLFRSEAPRGAPVARLEGAPVTSVSASFSPSSWYSSITGVASQKAGAKGSRYTAPNLLYAAASYKRATTISIDDTESADVPKAVKAAVGRMLASVVSYTIDDLPGWRDPHGELWRPNTTLTLLAPGAMVYRETELLIRSVRFHQSATTETTSLGLVLPGTFGGELPTELPWGS